jgi:hypothetical protein
VTVHVVTVFAPRREIPQWRDDYLELLRLQRATARHWGHAHVVVTDADLGREFKQLRVELPRSLMRAQLAGQIAWLERSLEGHSLLVDADVLIARECDKAFGDWDLGLTPRTHPTAPINNGAIYVPEAGKPGALQFFRAALERCGEHWGGDQEAISACAAPVLEAGSRAERCGARVEFLPIQLYNVSPKQEGVRHGNNPFVVHFKGAAKAWAATYARRWILRTR